MSTLANIIGQQGNFNEPATTDNSSAPAMPQVQQPLPAVLAPKQLKKPSKLKNPSALAAAMSRSKRAHQTGEKWG